MKKESNILLIYYYSAELKALSSFFEKLTLNCNLYLLKNNDLVLVENIHQININFTEFNTSKIESEFLIKNNIFKIITLGGTFQIIDYEVYRKHFKMFFLQWSHFYSFRVFRHWQLNELKFKLFEARTFYQYYRVFINYIYFMRIYAGKRSLWILDIDADVYFLQGEEYRNIALDFGINSNKIKVFGNSVSDALNIIVDNYLIEEKIIEPKKNAIFVCDHFRRMSHIPYNLFLKSIEDIYQFLIGRKYNLKIRMHPKDTARDINIFREKFPLAIIELPEIDLFASLEKSDLVFGINSTSLITAEELNKIVFSYWPYRNYKDIDLRRRWNNNIILLNEFSEIENILEHKPKLSKRNYYFSKIGANDKIIETILKN